MRERRRRHVPAFTAALLACGGLWGCSGSGPTTSLRIQVQDAASGQPLAGVVVIGETCSRDHPFSVASLVGQTGPRDARAWTGADGRASLTVPTDWPVRVTAVAPGYTLGQRWLEVPLPADEVRFALTLQNSPAPAEPAAR